MTAVIRRNMAINGNGDAPFLARIRCTGFDAPRTGVSATNHRQFLKKWAQTGKFV